MPETVVRRSVTSMQILARLGQERGVPLQALLASTALRPRDLEDPATVVSVQQELQLVRNLLGALGDVPGFGLEAGSRYHFTALGPVGFAVISCATLRHALDVSVQYADLNFALTRLAVEDCDDECRIVFDDRGVPADVYRFTLERAAAAVFTVTRDLIGDAAVPRRVRFGFAAPPAPQAYAEFFGVLPQFGAARNDIAVSAELIARPLSHANPVALRMAEAQCRQVLAARKTRSGFAERVRDRILGQPGRMPDMETVAAELCLTARTLRRRLQEEGTTYLALCEEVRETLAEELLSMARLPVEQVAERLGYSEASSFIHAFKRWKGQTPHAYRRGVAA